MGQEIEDRYYDDEYDKKIKEANKLIVIFRPTYDGVISLTGADNLHGHAAKITGVIGNEIKEGYKFLFKTDINTYRINLGEKELGLLLIISKEDSRYYLKYGFALEVRNGKLVEYL